METVLFSHYLKKKKIEKSIRNKYYFLTNILEDVKMLRYVRVKIAGVNRI